MIVCIHSNTNLKRCCNLYGVIVHNACPSSSNDIKTVANEKYFYTFKISSHIPKAKRSTKKKYFTINECKN